VLGWAVAAAGVAGIWFGVLLSGSGLSFGVE
jgi:hypothetical protein